MSKSKSISVIMMGGTGAVGGQAIQSLLPISELKTLTLLGRRRPVADILDERVTQHKIDIHEPSSYAEIAKGHSAAICTLGVGEPSKISKEAFLKIDKTAVINFAKACKEAGIEHFELLASVGISAKSSSFYLRTKGELVEELKALNFKRLSIFLPSMILTPKNRYGFTQALALAVWPILDNVFIGTAKKYKGIKVSELGKAIAVNVFVDKIGYEELTWEDFQKLN
ncbi:MAG: hypothetical protein ACI9IP_000328 [Arcticibacterium sp.]|jgi:uncharacterized protein YbjT (DUF2867 family)